MSKTFAQKISGDFTIVGFLAAIYIVVSLTQWYSSVVDHELSAVAKAKMEINIKQVEVAIEAVIDESVNDLMLLARYIAKQDIDEHTVSEYLRTQSQVEEFESIHYVTRLGHGIGVDGEAQIFTNRPVFTRAFENDYIVSAPYISSHVGEFVFNVAVPIKKNGQVVAVLIGETSMKDFNEIIHGTIARYGVVFLLDHSLNIIYSTLEKYNYYRSIPSAYVESIGQQNILDALENIKAGESGSILYQLGDVQKIFVYAPINMTEWAFVISMDIYAVAPELVGAVEQIYSVAVVVLLILLALAISIWMTKSSLLRSIEEKAYYDALTGLPNVIKFKLDVAAVLNENQNIEYSILKFDVEKFMVVNEMFGFEVGNRVLQAVREAASHVKEPSLLVAKTGTDEFFVFARSCFLNNIERRTKVYEKYFKRFIPELKSYNLSFKYAKYNIELGETNIDDIVNKVNFAHKTAKKTKGMRLHIYNDDVRKRVFLEAQIADKMKYALENDHFKVYLQPKIKLANNGLVGAEALVRWIEPSGKVIFPDVFIPLFERNGFISHLDRYVFITICKTIRRWLDEGKACVPISINCSRVNLTKPNIVNDILEITSQYCVPHKYIDIELTESTMLEDEALLEDFINQMHNAAINVSIDDFGAGYSSLGLLKNIKAHTLKLDKSFFNNRKSGDRADDVVAGIIRLAHKLNMYVVAEGIETAEQIENLRYVKCDAVQGYFYSKPMPMADFEEKYARAMCPVDFE